MNLKLLESMNPEISAYGRTAMAVSATGPLAHPTVQGQVYIRDAGISYTDLPNGLANLNGTLVFNQNRLVIQKLSAQTGGGTLDLGGFIAYDRGIYFNLTATGKSIRIRYPEGVSLQADANLHYTGTFAGSLLAGDVLVDRFDVTPQFDLALYIARSIRPAPGPTPSRALDNVKFDVHITSAPELEVQASSGFKVTGDADLRVRGTAARPAVLGRVEISEGEVKFNNTTYQLDRGDITFTNPTLIEPVFNIEATTRVRDYDITIGFHGKADRLRTTYRSDPPLPEGDIIALLAMGRTRDESPTLSSQTTSPFTEAASNAILGAAISNVLSSRAQRLFGLSQIKIDPSVGGPDNNPNARLTIEQQVSGRVTLTYITNLAQSAQQVIQAEFQINRNLSIIGVRDQYGVVGFDVRYRHRKK
ncbi:MAG: translocation/assembly module TamB domain-containing protein [Rhodospirillaceae bacterium]